MAIMTASCSNDRKALWFPLYVYKQMLIFFFFFFTPGPGRHLLTVKLKLFKQRNELLTSGLPTSLAGNSKNSAGKKEPVGWE